MILRIMRGSVGIEQKVAKIAKEDEPMVCRLSNQLCHLLRTSGFGGAVAGEDRFQRVQTFGSGQCRWF